MRPPRRQVARRTIDLVAVRAKLLVGVDEAAALLSCGRTTVFELVRTGEISARKIGRRTLFRVRDLEAWSEMKTTRALDAGRPYQEAAGAADDRTATG